MYYEARKHTRSMHIRLDEDIDTSNPVELDFLVLVFSPVALGHQIRAFRIDLIISYPSVKVSLQHCPNLLQ